MQVTNIRFTYGLARLSVSHTNCRIYFDWVCSPSLHDDNDNAASRTRAVDWLLLWIRRATSHAVRLYTANRRGLARLITGCRRRILLAMHRRSSPHDVIIAALVPLPLPHMPSTPSRRGYRPGSEVPLAGVGGLDPLKICRRGHSITSVKFESFFEFDSYSRTRGHSYKLKKNRFNRELRQHFFTERIVNIWNKLEWTNRHSFFSKLF